MSTTANPVKLTTTIVTTSLTTPRVVPSLINTVSPPGGSSSSTPNSSMSVQASPARMPAMYSLGMIAATLDSFNGRDALRYMQKFEQRAELDGWTEEETLKLFKYKCTGEAHDFLTSDPMLSGLNFRALKERFITRFHVRALPGENQLRLSKCYQRHDESVATYCTRLRMLGASVLQEDLCNASAIEEPGIRKKNQDLILNQFKLGLRKDVMREVGVLLLQESSLTLEKAEHLVSLQETTMKMIQGRHSDRPVMVISCYACGESGHISRDCIRSKRNERKSAENHECYQCGQQGHWARACPRNKPEAAHRPSWKEEDKIRLAREPLGSSRGYNDEHYGARKMRGNNERQGDGFSRPEESQKQGTRDYRRQAGGARNYEDQGRVGSNGGRQAKEANYRGDEDRRYEGYNSKRDFRNTGARSRFRNEESGTSARGAGGVRTEPSVNQGSLN